MTVTIGKKIYKPKNIINEYGIQGMKWGASKVATRAASSVARYAKKFPSNLDVGISLALKKIYAKKGERPSDIMRTRLQKAAEIRLYRRLKRKDVARRVATQGFTNF